MIALIVCLIAGIIFYALSRGGYVKATFKVPLVEFSLEAKEHKPPTLHHAPLIEVTRRTKPRSPGRKMIMMRIESCQKCGRPFSVHELGGQMPGTKEPEEITCPSCHTLWGTEGSNGTFQTAALTPQQEDAYKKGSLKSG